jgi:putative restriction endonuclease
MKRIPWSREELILAFNLYLKLPFGQMHHRNLEIIQLSNIINRTANAVAMRLSNFASVDPYHQQRGIKGLTGGIKQVEPIWNEFIHSKEDLLFESEKILADLEKITIENKFAEILKGIENLKGETKIREVKTRVNQNVFRQIVLSNYNRKCAITGIDIPDFLIAGHISPWGADEPNRLNPRNGIAINVLHDKAFENGYITITPDYQIKVSSILLKQPKNEVITNYFIKYNNQGIHLPSRFLPDPELLKYHNQERFKP